MRNEAELETDWREQKTLRTTGMFQAHLLITFPGLMWTRSLLYLDQAPHMLWSALLGWEMTRHRIPACTLWDLIAESVLSFGRLHVLTAPSGNQNQPRIQPNTPATNPEFQMSPLGMQVTPEVYLLRGFMTPEGHVFTRSWFGLANKRLSIRIWRARGNTVWFALRRNSLTIYIV